MKIVLAYSGGLDTSVIVKWLRETYDAEIVTFAADIGQEEELKGLPQKARPTGAAKHYTLDLVEEFASDFIYPMIRANAIYESQYYLGTSIARPLIAKRQVEIARQEGADAVAHGATGKGNDQVRFELTFAALGPELAVIAPWRTWDMRGRADLIAYAERHRIPITVTAEKPYSMDRNLLHVSYEGGVLEDPWNAPRGPRRGAWNRPHLARVAIQRKYVVAPGFEKCVDGGRRPSKSDGRRPVIRAAGGGRPW